MSEQAADGDLVDRELNWSTLIGHDNVRRWLSTAIQRGRLGGSFLLVGPAGIGKRSVAKLLAKTLLCDVATPVSMNPCGKCPACVQVEAQTHPDLVRVCKPADRASIPLELLIGPKEARMQEGFCRDVRIKPMRGTRKVAILEDADFLQVEGANCLLKTLEEPPAGAVVLLISTNEQGLLPTIRSRCQIIRMGPLAMECAARLLREVHHVQASDEQIIAAVDMAGGDMRVAQRLLDGKGDSLRQALTGQLRAPHPDPMAVQRIITGHVKEAGKEANDRRAAMRDAFSISLQYYRKRMREEVQQSDDVDPMTLARLDRAVRAFREVDRNANQSTLIECFAADIAAGITGDRGDIG